MKTFPLFVILCSFINTNVHADVYKCKVGNKTQFSDQPCKDGGGKIEAKGVTVSKSNTAPDTLKKKDEESNVRLKKKSLSDDIDRNDDRIRQLNKQRVNELSALQRRVDGSSVSMRDAMDKNTAASQMQIVNMNYDNQIKVIERDIERLKSDRDAVGKK